MDEEKDNTNESINQKQKDEELNLFNLESNYKEYLKEGIVNKELIKVFEEKDYSISKNAIILNKDKKNWIIKDKDTIFTVEDTGEQLIINKTKNLHLTDQEQTQENALSKFQKKIEIHLEKIKAFLKIEKKEEISDKEEFITSTMSHFAILLVIVLIVDLAIKKYTSSSPNSLYPLQVFETKLVYHIQSLFGIPVELVNSTTLRYDGSSIKGLFPNQNIGPECTGFHETIFILLLVLGFRYISWKIKIKWALILGGIIFIENIFRIVLLYPLAVWKGADWEEKFHFYWWHYGQYMVVMGLFVLWFWFVARHEADKYFEQIEKDKAKKPETS